MDMKALWVEKPGHYALKDVPVPEIGDDDVLVKVGAASICHSDLDIVDGRRKHLISFPRIPGHEFAGTIVKVGRHVARVAPGDTVVCENIVWCGVCSSCRQGRTSYCKNYSELGTLRDGGFAEYAALPGHMVQKFSKMSMIEAANIEPAGNAYHAAEEAGIGVGESVLIIGPGPIGLYALQMAKLYQPGLLIMAGTRESRLKIAQDLGADVVVNVRQENPVERIMQLTGGKGVNRVIQCATKTDAVELALSVVSEDGTIIIEGLDDTNSAIPLPFNNFIFKYLTIKGVGGVTTRQFAETIALMENHYITTRGIVTHVISIDELVHGIDMLRDRVGDPIKITVQF
jgi:L-iditol 2-dehydrogenase